MGTNYITFSVVLSLAMLSLSHSLVTRRYITLATYFYDLIARWLSRNGFVWSRFPLSKFKMKGEALSCRNFPEVLDYSFLYVGRVLWILRRRSGSFNLALESENHFCRCRRGRAAAALSLFPSFLPSFGGPEITWRFHEYPPSLPRSIVSRSPVCVPSGPSVPPTALAHSGNKDSIQRYFVSSGNEMVHMSICTVCKRGFIHHYREMKKGSWM